MEMGVRVGHILQNTGWDGQVASCSVWHLLCLVHGISCVAQQLRNVICDAWWFLLYAHDGLNHAWWLTHLARNRTHACLKCALWCRIKYYGRAPGDCMIDLGFCCMPCAVHDAALCMSHNMLRRRCDASFSEHPFTFILPRIAFNT